MRIKIIFPLGVILFSLNCKKELDIHDFSDDFSFYQSELRIEALILPSQNTAIVRIDRSVPLDEADLYNCEDDDLDWNYYFCNSDSISYESKGECLEACGDESDCILHLYSCKVDEEDCEDCNWPFDTLKTYPTKTECLSDCPGKCLTDDVGEDGMQAYDSNDDGDYDDIGFGGDIAPDDGEGDGIPGCNEPEVDEYDEILPHIHLDSFCTVRITHETGTCNFIFKEDAGIIFEGTENHGVKIDDIRIVSYGAWIPDSTNCDIEFNQFDTEYQFSCECSEESGYGYYGEITSRDTIRRPVIFYSESDEEEVKSCANQPDIYGCLESFHNTDSLYFEENDPSAKIYYASLFESIKYQTVQYIYDESNDRYVYYHGHPDGGTDSGDNFIDNKICLMFEIVVAEKYDEANKFKYDIFTFSPGYENYYFFSILDLSDPERTNLRDQNGNPVMGAFGAMSSRTKYFEVIDTLQSQ